MNTLITVPMKDPALAKTRLATTLSPSARHKLARLLYRRTLELLQNVAATAGADLAVVTQAAETLALAQEFGAYPIVEPSPPDLCESVYAASQWAIGRGYTRLCVIPADLVAPAQDELLDFLQSPAQVTICPSADQGTNALLLSPPDAIDFRYGPASALAHFAAAEAAGLAPRWMPLASLQFDLDHCEDLSRALVQVPAMRAVCP